jgi:hypothetical protein
MSRIRTGVVNALAEGIKATEALLDPNDHAKKPSFTEPTSTALPVRHLLDNEGSAELRCSTSEGTT